MYPKSYREACLQKKTNFRLLSINAKCICSQSRNWQAIHYLVKDAFNSQIKFFVRLLAHLHYLSHCLYTDLDGKKSTNLPLEAF